MSTPCPPIQPDGIMPLPCSGACSVGQLSHQAVIELTGAGFGRMYSLAAIAAGLAAAIADAGKARMVVAVDGCEKGCSRRILERTGIGCRHHLIITTLGIDREDSLRIDNDNLQLVKDAIQACCAEARPIIRLGGCMCGI
jgi:uncharacterized metal-binding protein